MAEQPATPDEDGPPEASVSRSTPSAERRGSESKNRGPGSAAICGHFPEAVRRQLRVIAAHEGRTIQSLLAEALNEIFRKRGQLPIARE